MRKSFSLAAAAALALLLLSSPAQARTPEKPGAVTPAEATSLMQERSMLGLHVLDVRTDAEYEAGHIEGAIHVPVDDLEKRLGDIPHAPLLIVCRSGVRAGRAYDILSKHGYDPRMIWYLKGYTDYGFQPPRFYQ